MFEANKVDNEYNEICETIINDKKKLKDITFNKYVIINDILYYKNRLWIFEFIYTIIIQEIHDQFIYNYLKIVYIYELFKRKYY